MPRRGSVTNRVREKADDLTLEQEALMRDVRAAKMVYEHGRLDYAYKLIAANEGGISWGMLAAALGMANREPLWRFVARTVGRKRV